MGSARGPRNRSAPVVTCARRARKSPSAAEAIVWELLRDRKLGFKFRREYAVANFRIDFYCAEAMLGVEFDGEQHDPDRDAKRDQEIAKRGIEVFRVPNRSFFMVELEEVPSDWIKAIQVRCEARTGRRAFP